MMDYSYHHQYNMYPEYYTPQYAQQYPPYPTMPNFLNPMSSGAGTSTPTLTPTSLASLEQTFIELQSVPPHHHGNNNGHNNNGSNGAGAGVNSNNNNIGGCDPHTQSGFVPPVVDPSSREQSQDSFESDPEWEPVLKRGRGGGGGGLVMGGGEGEDSPGGGGGGHHQANGGSQRKYTRRSRNEKLSPEEEERRKVRRERNKLAAAKCRQRRVDHTNALVEETEKLEAEKSDLENEIQSLQQQKDQLEFLLQAHVPLCKVDPGAATIKIEPSEGSCLGTASLNTCTSSSSSSSSHMPNASSRPTSLALDRPQQNGGLPELGVTCAPPGHGVSLSTPSSGMYSYTDLDSLVDGPSGLTPLTSGPAVSCSNQLHRIESDSGPEGVGKGKVLVQL